VQISPTSFEKTMCIRSETPESHRLGGGNAIAPAKRLAIRCAGGGSANPKS
jgi:hypothetical protein